MCQAQIKSLRATETFAGLVRRSSKTFSRDSSDRVGVNLQDPGWALGYNSLALPIAAGVFEPLGFVLRPEVAAISMSGSSVLVALNAVALKRLPLPQSAEQPPPEDEEPRQLELERSPA